MQNSLSSEWFFIRQGEKIGPVSFEEMREVATLGGLNPRLDLAWTEGMADWKPAGEISGLFERNIATPEEASAAMADPSGASAAGIVLDKDSGWPGAGRGAFLFFVLVFPILWAAGLHFGLPLLKPHAAEEHFRWIALLAPFFPIIPMIGTTLSRFRNLGMSRWWFFGKFVPLLNLWVEYRLTACPPGYPWHKKMDGIGWLLAVLYWALVICTLAVLGLALAIFSGSLGDPELQQKLREIIKPLADAAANAR